MAALRHKLQIGAIINWIRRSGHVERAAKMGELHMMKLIGLAATLTVLASPAAYAQRQTRVDTYVKRDGTVVQSHARTAPDSSRYNNWSSKPNVNPYTGRTGTVDPARPSTGYQPYKPYKPYKPK